MTNLYTNSRLKTLRECLRKHMYKYVLGIRTPSTNAMDFGTVGHAALEAYLIAWKIGGQCADRLFDALGVIAGAALPEIDKAKLRVLVAAYDLRWGTEPWEIMAVEAEFRYELGGYLIGGKIDGVVRDQRDGRTYVLEHKFTRQDAAPGGTYWARLSLDAQISIYVDGATVLGHEIAGCIYDVIQRPGHEQKLATPIDVRKYTLGKGCKGCGGSAGGKAGVVQGRGHYIVAGPGETPQEIACEQCAGTGWKLDDAGVPQAPRLHANQRDADETLDAFTDRLTEEIAADVDGYLVRGVVVRLDDDLPKMRDDLIAWIKIEQLSSTVFGAEQPRNTESCASFGSLCPFYAACSGSASIDDQHLFPRGAAHPELAAA